MESRGELIRIIFIHTPLLQDDISDEDFLPWMLLNIAGQWVNCSFTVVQCFIIINLLIKGSQKVFLDVQYEHKYEQTLMSQAMMTMRAGKMKVGTLLASPINHKRIYHYDGKKRKENKH